MCECACVVYYNAIPHNQFRVKKKINRNNSKAQRRVSFDFFLSSDMFHLSRCVYLTIVLFLPFWQFFYLVNLTFSYFRGFHFYFLCALISLFLVYINSFPRPDQCFFFIFLVFSASFHRNILELLQKKQGKRVK